ncbi:CBS domain-containing protein [Neptunomonas qingdaonensis]|uniref:CBS domain-containing protein n=1 Tax=Neptunomonas qingdaonensis TaxID=1045558 RepID=A0A1I2TA95_9GAMM|nr:CBS domain-containing protein [Neptunomonas qingdaonensis]SFG61805.1 CBS domain-containing protein [Neptunomonas qingdaonensis]
MLPTSIINGMNKKFALIKPHMPVVEACGELIKKEMLGGPVINDDGELVGWISEQECLQVIMQVVYHNQRVATVQDIMRTDVLSMKPNDEFMAIAEQMLQQKPKSYPVVDNNNKVIGVVNRRHILNMLLKQLADVTKQ